jgi:hypothetical protein
MFTGMEPRYCSAPDDCVINATFSNSEPISGTGYCRFDHVLVQAESVEQGLMRCRVPRLPAAAASVSISFDSSHFSERHFTLTVPGEGDLRAWLALMLLAGVGVAVATAVCRHTGHRRVPRGADHDLLAPSREGVGA